ncbi:MAG: hypothetical protein IJK58_09430 [Clostridia bacterium]|nr:hypothetical protein [Clostridia bacterium]
MKDKLRDHIERNLIRRGASKDAGEFLGIVDRLTAAAEEEYDRIAASGKTDLEAYRGAVEKVMPELNRSAVFLNGTVGEADGSASEDEKDAEKDPEKEAISALESTAHAVLWLITVAAYFAVSFIFGHWNITWLMFLSAAAGSVVINMVFALNRGRTIVDEWDNLNGIVWLVTIGIYFLVSFLTGKWAFTWLIFIAAIAASVILDAVKKTMVRSQGGDNSQDGGEGSDE